MLMMAELSMAQLKPVDDQSKVSFRIKNLGFGVTGTFSGLQGHIRFDPAKPADALFDVTVNAASVNTDNSTRDEHLRGETYFDVKKYPVIRFVSDAVTAGQVTGKLTVKDITKTISFPFTATHTGGGYTFSGSFHINRRDFHVGGGSTISDNLDVTLQVVAK